MRFRRCVKCGERYNTPEYKTMMGREYLHYVCSVCGYSWNEKTEDFEPKIEQIKEMK